MSTAEEHPVTPDTEDRTRLIVNVTPRAYHALCVAADRHGDTRTDTISRSLQLYEAVTALKPGERLTFDASANTWFTLARLAPGRVVISGVHVGVGLLLIALAFAAGVVSPW